MTNIHGGELQLLAQQILRSNQVELGDDPRTEIQVAVAMGFLALDSELARLVNAPASD